jgi:hypothetical protein
MLRIEAEAETESEIISGSPPSLSRSFSEAKLGEPTPLRRGVRGGFLRLNLRFFEKQITKY